jgi:hypothetical protein
MALWIRQSVETPSRVRSSATNLFAAAASHGFVLTAILFLRLDYHDRPRCSAGSCSTGVAFTRSISRPSAERAWTVATCPLWADCLARLTGSIANTPAHACRCRGRSDVADFATRRQSGGIPAGCGTLAGGSFQSATR